MQMNRRAFLQTGAAGLLGTLAASRLAFASAPTDNRFVFVFLRGGLDGLHALPPYADADYRRLRPGLALQADQVLSLDGYFGMHPSFAPLRPMWEAGSLAFVPAAATGYRERSHFDGQNMLENGSGHPFGARDGWLNRAILGLNAGDRRLGLALGLGPTWFAEHLTGDPTVLARIFRYPAAGDVRVTVPDAQFEARHWTA